MVRIICTPTPGEPRPWFIRTPIDITDWLKKNETEPIPRIDPDWKPPEDFKLHVMTAEEAESKWFPKPDKLQEELKAINAEVWASDLSEAQQWTLVETVHSIANSMSAMLESEWNIDHEVCGAVYGNNLAKIEFACRILGNEYKDKLKEVLDWYAKKTILQERNMFQIHPESADFKKMAQVFKQVGSNSGAGSGTELSLSADPKQDAHQFKKNLQESLYQLRLFLGKKSKATYNGNGWEYIPYEPLITDDWDNFFSKLISHNAGPANLSAYINKFDKTV